MTKPFAFYSQGIATGAFSSERDDRDIHDKSLTLAYPYASVSETNIDVLAVEHQRKIGICTSYLKSYIEYLYYKKTGKYVRLSAGFLYLVTKLYIDQNFIEGSSLRSVLKAAMKYGVCTEDTFPTNTDLTHGEFLNQKIPAGAWSEALNYRIGGYINIPVERSLIAAALDKYGLLYVRYELGDEWYTSKNGRVSWNKSDILPLRHPELIISGHAVLLNGYDLTKDKTKNTGRNSWSEKWADNGNFFTFYEDYAPTEAWAITLESVMPLKEHGPKVEDKTWRALLGILRKIGLIK